MQGKKDVTDNEQRCVCVECIGERRGRQTIGIAVVDGTEGMELLLSRRVPDGEVHADAVDRELLGQKRRLYCGQVLVVELVLDVPEHQRGLAHTPCVSLCQKK